MRRRRRTRHHRETAHAHIPEVGFAIELDELPLLERGEQPVGRGRRQPAAGRDVDQAVALVIVGEKFQQLHGTGERLHRAVAVAVPVDTGDLGGLAGRARRTGCHGVPYANFAPSARPCGARSGRRWSAKSRMSIRVFTPMSTSFSKPSRPITGSRLERKMGAIQSTVWQGLHRDPTLGIAIGASQSCLLKESPHEHRTQQKSAGSTTRMRASRPGKSGGRISASGSGARCARTTATTAMPGTTSPTTRPARAPTAGARTASPASATTTSVLCFALALWNGRDPILKERALRPDQQRGQPRRGRQGVLLLPRLARRRTRT